ncbi:unnamed protein product [Diamesa hyperborea]
MSLFSCWFNRNNFNNEERQINKLDGLQLRFLNPDDLESVRALCSDWFPIDYPLSWYEDITSSNRFFALAAVYNCMIIGLIVAEIKPWMKLNKEDKTILSEHLGRNSDIGYILSLGVHKKYRRNGVASILLDALIKNLTENIDRSKVKALFLHVLTTNQEAILFYERRNFTLHSFLPYYYSIRGKSKDGFCYVCYINGGHYPFTILDHIRNLCSTICSLSLFTWLINRVRSVFNWVCYHTIAKFNFPQ